MTRPDARTWIGPPNPRAQLSVWSAPAARVTFGKAQPGRPGMSTATCTDEAPGFNTWMSSLANPGLLMRSYQGRKAVYEGENEANWIAVRPCCSGTKM